MSSEEVIIALDGMGGDLAPGSVIEGAYLASKKLLNIKFNIYGNKNKILPILKKKKEILNLVNFRHTKEIITNDTKPTDALKKSKRMSSMFQAINSVHKGESQAVVSGGNTGALMAISIVLLKTIKGIDRPAIASMFPTIKSETIMLDLGANINCSLKNILDFVILGKTFAKTVLGLKKPKIGILNVGSEGLKGNELVRLAYLKLSKNISDVDFYGFVEGNDISKGIVNVIVTDGFTGNIALKTAEGTAELYTNFLKSSFKDNLLSKIIFLIASPILKSLLDRVDPSKYNGAMLLGLNGIVVKSHGGSKAEGFANAISVAYDLCVNDFNQKIIVDIKNNLKLSIFKK